MSTQSIDVNTTKYLYKPNVETTRYFVNDGGADIAEQVEQNTSDISDIKDRLDVDEILINDNTTNITNNTTNISTNTTDITNLKNRVSNCENNISTNTTNISNLQAQINGMSNNPYEGYYYSIYTDAGTSRAKIRYNYNIGDMMFWYNGAYWQAVVNDTYLGPLINQDIKDITLPSHVKQIDQNGNVTKYIDNITYYIETGNNRMTMNSLITLTTEPDVRRLNIDITAAPNLRYFNLLEGLQEIKINNTGNYPINLIIPSSVIKCELVDAQFNNLTFISDISSTALRLIITRTWIFDKLTCCRTLASNSSFTSDSNHYAPNVFEVNTDFIYMMPDSNCFGTSLNRNTSESILILRYSESIDTPGLTWTSKTFRTVYNQSRKAKSAYNGKITATNWYE